MYLVLAQAVFVFVCFRIVTIMWIVLSGLSILASKLEKKGTRETLSAFECGFDSKHFGRTSFSINFCIFLILFLVFDIELVFFFHLPMIQLTTLTRGIFLFLGVSCFIYFGFLYEEKTITWVYELFTPDF